MIFAEANHNLKRRIRPLNKGFTRIAFGAEDTYDWNLDLQIVPVGINYARHRKAGNTVQINYGEPIPVKKYRKLYLREERESVEAMKHDVSDAMKELVFHVDSLNEYQVQKILWDDLEPNELKTIDPAIANARIAKTKPYLSDAIIEKATSLNKKVERAGIELKDIAKQEKISYKHILWFPFYLFSLINNLIPYQPVRHLIHNVIKDHTFDASIKFLLSLIAFPFFYGIVSVVLALTGTEWAYILGYLFLSIITAPLFVQAKDMFTGSPKKKLFKQDPVLYKEIENELKRFTDLRETILSE